MSLAAQTESSHTSLFSHLPFSLPVYLHAPQNSIMVPWKLVFMFYLTYLFDFMYLFQHSSFPLLDCSLCSSLVACLIVQTLLCFSLFLYGRPWILQWQSEYFTLCTSITSIKQDLAPALLIASAFSCCFHPTPSRAKHHRPAHNEDPLIDHCGLHAAGPKRPFFQRASQKNLSECCGFSVSDISPTVFCSVWLSSCPNHSLPSRPIARVCL